MNFASHYLLDTQSLWDSLLDARIRLQKTVTTTNKITSVCTPLSPTNHIFDSWQSTSRSLLQSSDCQEDLQKYLEESVLLAEDLFELQEVRYYMIGSRCFAPDRNCSLDYSRNERGSDAATTQETENTRG